MKTYLLPDPHKVTKRKTRMVKKSRNPTYNEMVSSQMVKGYLQGILKEESGLFLTLVLALWDGGHLKVTCGGELLNLQIWCDHSE